jgi:acyl-CoA reductase-like NAD-dependent aldehyde dehydrogenase
MKPRQGWSEVCADCADLATEDMAVMREEIFGPILPIKRMRHWTTRSRINASASACVLSVRWRPARSPSSFCREPAQAVTLDDTLWHFSTEELPFGGRRRVGMGASHGERGFLTFTHEKPVFAQPSRSPDVAAPTASALKLAAFAQDRLTRCGRGWSAL